VDTQEREEHLVQSSGGLEKKKVIVYEKNNKGQEKKTVTFTGEKIIGNGSFGVVY